MIPGKTTAAGYSVRRSLVSQFHKTDFLLYGFILFLALALYLFYQSATPARLGFILVPVVKALELFLATPFTLQPEGYHSPACGVIIGSSCAGVHFLIISLLLLNFAYLGRFRSISAKWGAAGGFLAVSYLVTIGANFSRILISILIMRFNILASLPRESVHLGLGIFCYFFFLAATYWATGKLTDRKADGP